MNIAISDVEATSMKRHTTTVNFKKMVNLLLGKKEKETHDNPSHHCTIRRNDNSFFVQNSDCGPMVTILY